MKKKNSILFFLKKSIFKSDFSKNPVKRSERRVFGPEGALAVGKKATPAFLMTPRSPQVALRPVAPLLPCAYGAIAAHYGPESLKNRQIWPQSPLYAHKPPEKRPTKSDKGTHTARNRRPWVCDGIGHNHLAQTSPSGPTVMNSNGHF